MNQKDKFILLVSTKTGLKPAYSTMVTVYAYDEAQAKTKAIGKILENNPIFKRRKSAQYWKIEIIKKGIENGSEEKNDEKSY